MNDQKNVKPEHDLPALLTELAEIKARFEAIITAIGDPLVIIDRNYKITYQNDLAQELLGNKVGNHCYETFLKEIASCGECPVNRAWETGGVVRTEQSLLLSGGEKFFEIISSPIRDAKGRITDAIEIIRDITKFKQKSPERQKEPAQLEKLNSALSICSHCKDIRNDQGDWLKFEKYLNEHREILFSHGICPDCLKKHHPEFPQNE